MNRFAKTTLFLFSIAVVIVVGVIGFHMYTSVGNSLGKGTPSITQGITCNDWNLMTSPSPGSDSNTLSAIAAVSARDVWAVGATKNNNSQQVLVEHWNGSSWRTVSAPVTGSSGDELHGIVALNANDIWAVGSSYNFSVNRYGALIEHWDGSQWSIVKSASTSLLNNNLLAIAAIAPQDIWAVGLSFSNNQNQPRQTLIEHWDGSQWSIVKSVNPGGSDSTLSSVTAISSDDVWAVGGSQSRELIEHWNGKKWSAVSGPALPGVTSASLNSVAAVAHDSVWAVGQENTLDSGDGALVEHWNGTTWSSVPIGNPEAKMDWLYSISVISANDIWAVGEFKDYNTRLFRTFAMHWDGKQWGLSQWPWRYGQANNGDSFGMAAVVAVDKQHIWAVGSVTNITQNPPIDNPPHNGSIHTFTLFRC